MGNASNPVSSDIRPRLWVETLWLLESLTAEQPLREIPLSRGLNLIVSPPRTDSPGHGVGKTAFCQLLRFVLDDPLWSEGSTLRDELLQDRELKAGAVAARCAGALAPARCAAKWQRPARAKRGRCLPPTAAPAAPAARACGRRGATVGRSRLARRRDRGRSTAPPIRG